VDRIHRSAPRRAPRPRGPGRSRTARPAPPGGRRARRGALSPRREADPRPASRCPACAHTLRRIDVTARPAAATGVRSIAAASGTRARTGTA
jgi:hypothetical protein